MEEYDVDRPVCECWTVVDVEKIATDTSDAIWWKKLYFNYIGVSALPLYYYSLLTTHYSLPGMVLGVWFFLIIYIKWVVSSA